MDIHPSRAPTPVMISKRNKETGEMELVEVVPAGSLETLRLQVGRKKGQKKFDPNRFAESENECWAGYLTPGKRY